MREAIPEQPAAWRFIVPALMIPLFLGLTLVWLQSEYERWETLRLEAQSSNTRRSQVSDMLSVMRSAETSQRGYAISGDESLRSRFAQAERETRALLRALYAAFGDDLVQQRQVAELDRTVDAKFAEMDEVVHLHDTQGAEAALQRIGDGEGQRLMAKFELLANRVIQREVATGEQRVQVFAARSATIQRTMWFIVAVGSVSLAVLLWLLWRQRQAQYRGTLAVHEAAERNQAILNGTADPIFIINPSGTIETVNAAVTRLLGYQPQDLARRDVSIVADIAPGTGSFQERIGLVDGLLAKNFLHEQLVRDQRGGLTPYDIALGTMRLPDGDHLVMSLRDTTERRRLDRLKDDLISAVSHELRTPLTSIIGALSLLHAEAAGELPQEAKELIKIAANNGQRLIRLINDMLDIDRIEAGKFRLSTAPIDLRDVVMRGCENYAGLARSRGADLSCHVPDEPIAVEADDDRILQVIGNLVSNALKFTPEGGSVRVGIRRASNGKMATVHVDDEGPGIAEEFRSRIFGRFERAMENEGAAGTGLGLAIAREIVTRHGGEIWFEDLPSGGTRFSFSLPTAAPATVARDIKNETSILICEDNPVVGRSLQSLLASEGYASRIVTTAHAAREALAEDGYTVLLLDMTLDDANAFEIARDLRGKTGPDSLSILVLSPQSHEESASSISLDLIDWIDKPIDAMRLKAAVTAGVGRTPVKRPIVLHLDDDQDTLDVTAMALEGQADILKARSVEEARQLLAEHAPHLAILDYHLEDESGLDLVPDLVTAEGIAIPTIVYSARDVALDDGLPIDAVLVKSRTSIPDLKATIRRIVSARYGDRQS